MKRLPYYDHRTSRSEFAAYLALGLVGTTATLFAVHNALTFAASREDIITALSAPIPSAAIVASNNNHRTFTNITHIEGNSSKEPRWSNRNSTGPRS